jgi:hypothetical protein
LAGPGGILSGAVVSANDGKPITSNSSRYRLALEDKPELFISSTVNENGEFTTPIPHVPITMTVTCEGYEPATVQSVTLPSGERGTIILRLKKSSVANNKDKDHA